jgi:hypothetical protein
LIAGERDPAVLADIARTRMRPKIGELDEALVGRFDEHHAVMARMHLDHVDQRTGIMDRLDAEVDRLMAPFAESATRVMSVPGIAKRSAEVVVSEIGNDMSASRPRSPLLPGPVSVLVMTSPGASVDPAGPQGQRRAPGGDVRGRPGRLTHPRHLSVGAYRRFKRRLGTKKRRQSHPCCGPHHDRHRLAHSRQREHHLPRARRRLLRPPQRRRSPPALHPSTNSNVSATESRSSPPPKT